MSKCSNQLTLKCKRCSKQFNNSKRALEHLKTHNIIDYYAERQTNPITLEVTCGSCHEILPNMAECNYHHYKQHNRNELILEYFAIVDASGWFYCSSERCNSKFKVQRDLDQHYYEFHKLQPCQQCGKKVHDLRKHMLSKNCITEQRLNEQKRRKLNEKPGNQN